MLLDNSAGIQIFTYEGRQICNPRFQGLRTELLNAQMISLSNDCIAVLDQSGSSTTVRFFDTAQVRAQDAESSCRRPLAASSAR